VTNHTWAAPKRAWPGIPCRAALPSGPKDGTQADVSTALDAERGWKRQRAVATLLSTEIDPAWRDHRDDGASLDMLMPATGIFGLVAARPQNESRQQEARGRPVVNGRGLLYYTCKTATRMDEARLQNAIE